jgi:CRISPR-associated protein Csx14
MKTAVIAPLGMSPPIVTAGLDAAEFKVKHLVIIATKHPVVLAGLDLIEVAMSVKAPKVKIHTEILPFDDVTTTQENLVFMETAIRLIREARVKNHCDRVLLDVAGGRKNMCITLTMIGQLMNVDSVFHIGNPNINLLNTNLELLRKDIDRIHMADTLKEKQAIYHEKEDQFDHVLFPAKSDYEIIRVPTFPVDQSSVQRLLFELKGEVRGKVKELSIEDKVILERHGILEKGRSHYYVSDYGQKFLDAFI